MVVILHEYYDNIKKQSTKNTNIGNEICCSDGQSLQEIERNAIKKMKTQPELLLRILTRNRPGIANRLCVDNM